MDGINREYEIERHIKNYKLQISYMISGPCVIQKLSGFLKSTQVSDICRQYQHSASKATLRMIEYLLECRSPGKWQAFVMALQQSDYPYLVSLLEGLTDGSEKHVKKVLQVFAPYLELQVNPEQLIDSLRAGGAINDTDAQEIRACHTQTGAVTATAILLERIQCRLAPSEWYLKFLKTLHRKGYQSLVEDMEPDFTIDCEVLKCPIIPEPDNQLEEQSIKSSELEERIERNVKAIKEEMSERVEIESILSHIQCELLDIESVSIIRDNCKESNFKAVETMLIEIDRLKSARKWRMFVECLKKAEYPAIVEKLLSETPPLRSFSTENWIIAIFNAILQSNINPDTIAPLLVSENVINERDRVYINETYQQYGSTIACGKLIQRMQSRQSTEKWYKVFLETLTKCHHEDLVKVIDPDFYEKFIMQKTSTETSEAATTDDSSKLKKFKERISLARKRVKSMTGRVEETIRGYSKVMDTIKSESITELQSITRQLMVPIEKVTELIQQYSESIIELRPVGDLEMKIKNELNICESTTLATEPNVDLCENTKLIAIHINKTTPKENAKCTLNQHVNVKRIRKYSVESLSSGSSGYLEVTGKKNSMQQMSTSNESLEKDRDSWSSSNPSTRNTSPIPPHTRVSFKEPLDDNPSLALKQRIYDGIKRHKRSSSMGDLNGITKPRSRRQRTLSEPSIKEEQEEVTSKDLHKSLSLDGASWIKKCDIQTHTNNDKSYLQIYAEDKTGRKRTSSDSNSVFSDVSILTKSSVSSNGYPSDCLSSHGRSSDLATDNESSMLLHEKHCMHSGKCFLTDVWAFDSSCFVMVDHNAGAVLLYDSNIKQFRTLLSSTGRCKPYKIAWVENDALYVLFKSQTCLSKINRYEVKRDEGAKSKRRVIALQFSSSIQFSCIGDIADIKGLKKQIVAACFNKHVHFIKDTQVLRTLQLHVDLKEWWPNSTAIQVHKTLMYLYDLYSQKLFCFNTKTGIEQWNWPLPKEEGIEGITLFGSKIYLAQNYKGKIAVLNNNDHERPSKMTDLGVDIKYPFALNSTDTALLSSQYRRGQHKVNRTLKCF